MSEDDYEDRTEGQYEDDELTEEEYINPDGVEEQVLALPLSTCCHCCV